MPAPWQHSNLERELYVKARYPHIYSSTSSTVIRYPDFDTQVAERAPDLFMYLPQRNF